MKGEVLFSGIPTASLESAQPWYESLFGRPPDVVANDHEVMWEVREGGWLYVVEDKARAGHALVAVAVSDLGRLLDELEQRGFERPQVEIVPGAGNKAPLVDPEGNRVALIEVKDSGS
jgi:predicted enzyme related to lactoylglutathione lyase